LAEYINSNKPIIIVRHGQSSCNIDPKVHGYHNPGLTEIGRKQAYETGKRLSIELQGKDFTIYSSPMNRAIETAKIICTELGAEPILVTDLEEYRTNLPVTMPYDEANSLFGKSTESSIPINSWRLVPSAETFGELYNRAKDVLSRIIEMDEGEVIVIVSHGWIIDKMIAWWIGVGYDNLQVNHFINSNASICELTNTEFNERVILRLNDKSHLVNIQG
jgi:probable phosphoglycerate mutase